MDFLKKLMTMLNPTNASGTKSKLVNIGYAAVALYVAVKAAYDYFSVTLPAG